ncbi:MAG TPA: hypothetical protein ENN81_01120 [Phycisphaerales bacterium]|nr:hypothetical protein [Phycisphaerales bacterium]
MLQLHGTELAVFVLVLLVYLAATTLAVWQLLRKSRRPHRLILPLVALGATLETVLLVFRAVAMGAVPLTGLFESMIVLTIALALLYLFLAAVIEQVWFSSVMVWAISALFALAGIVAEPAAQPQQIAATPWAIVHGIAMILGGVSIMLAAAASGLYLLVAYKLKQKRLTQVLGKMPNIERLERTIRQALLSAFIFITVGIVGGVGLIYMHRTSIIGWLADPKVLCILGTWLLLAAVQVLHKLLLLKGRTQAYITLAAFALVLFAILGVAILGATRHKFKIQAPPATTAPDGVPARQAAVDYRLTTDD